MTLFNTLLSLAFTAFISNRLLRSWQDRSWLQQQKYLGQEKEYRQLASLAEDIASSGAARLFAMEQLNSELLRSDPVELENRLNEYREHLKRWNEKLPVFFFQLRAQNLSGQDIKLEVLVHSKMYEIGRLLEQGVRARRNNSAIKNVDLQNRLASVKAAFNRFNEDLFKATLLRRADLYFEVELPVTADLLSRMSTWDLVKAIFHRDINGYTITRASLN